MEAVGPEGTSLPACLQPLEAVPGPRPVAPATSAALDPMLQLPFDVLIARQLGDLLHVAVVDPEPELRLIQRGRFLRLLGKRRPPRAGGPSCPAPRARGVGPSRIGGLNTLHRHQLHRIAWGGESERRSATPSTGFLTFLYISRVPFWGVLCRIRRWDGRSQVVRAAPGAPNSAGDGGPQHLRPLWREHVRRPPYLGGTGPCPPASRSSIASAISTAWLWVRSLAAKSRMIGSRPARATSSFSSLARSVSRSCSR